MLRVIGAKLFRGLSVSSLHTHLGHWKFSVPDLGKLGLEDGL